MSWLWGLGTGFSAGIICMGGLYFGARLLLNVFSNKEENALKLTEKKRIFIGAFILIGQFIASAGIIYASRWVRLYPMITGLGILMAIGFGGGILFLQNTIKKP